MKQITKYVIATGIIITVIAVILLATIRIGNIGTIKTLGVTSDTSQIDWGELAAGIGANVTINLKVDGSPANLTLSTENWAPASASAYIHLTWDYVDGTVLQPNVWTPVTLILTVDDNITGITNFSFDIVISAQA